MKTYKEAIEYIKEYGCLPEDFTQWELANSSGWTVAHVAASRGNLPEGFTQWDLANKWGSTVAHWAAKCRHLPEDFDQWDLVNNEGRTVAHVYIQFYEQLPYEGIDLTKVTNDGSTIAHAAAYYGCLPKGFNQWDLADNKGKTIVDYFVNRHSASVPEWFDQWGVIVEDPVYNKPITIGHFLARQKRLPEGFSQWELADNNGWTIAHEAARVGKLPVKSFQNWTLADNKGWTVAHEIIKANKKISKKFHEWYVKDNRGITVFDLLLRASSPFAIVKWFPEEDWDLVITDDGETCREVLEKKTGRPLERYLNS